MRAIGLLLFACAVAHADPTSELQQAITRDYSHRDQRGVDWTARFATYAPKLRAASSPDAFATTASEPLSAAQDMHIHIDVAGRALNPVPTALRSNFDKSLVAPSSTKCTAATV